MSPTLSDLLGYSSIGFWLGAQFPQILENIRLKSCEGLALPFLANWFLGDASNLLGCLLTDQLPFQTWLAGYFVFVDIVLVSQYFYYQGLKPAPVFGRPRMGSAVSDRHYRTLSVVAANVSAAAALAAQQHDEHSGRPRRSVDMSGSRASEDSAFAAMADSFHSEGGVIPTRKRVSWSTERYGKRGGSVGRAPLSRSAFLPRITPTDQASDIVDRGRSLQRDAEQDEPAQSPTQSSGSNRRSSRASRRGASLVFLSLFALFGVGTWTGGRLGALQASRTNVGRVLTAVPMGFDPPPGVVNVKHLDFVIRADPQEPHHDPIPSDPSSERFLGRIFAWLCTILYLTSRLPQIWKNFVRKSVEGLSMLLFICAFLGNSFYVASILTSDAFVLRESLPYLLGSGGTLLFDISIVSQSVIYRRPRRHGKGRTMLEEEGGLMSGDALAHDPPTRGT
ncbi:PQ loop repeat-domain-containing protein [Mycena rosella]|uniref:PQ loop repeat-domain-containing protein n=1 Tax=Mycena rosella TaxID=1033263 RepID=A0AAD7H1L3_MYCRO|nr:PQ loop repeat-domain-containing protein [Mycena rosella]